MHRELHRLDLRERREHLIKGRGTVGKTAVIGAKDRRTNRVSAKVINNTDQLTLQSFVVANVEDGAKVYTDDHGGYVGLPNHETVRHSVKEYVNGQAHTNGIESFWSMLKRGYVGTYHRMSPKHLHRYVNEFAGRHNQREDDTIDQIAAVARGLGGRRLQYKDVDGGEDPLVDDETMRTHNYTIPPTADHLGDDLENIVSELAKRRADKKLNRCSTCGGSGKNGDAAARAREQLAAEWTRLHATSALKIAELTSSMRLPVSMRAVAMIYLDP